MSVRRMTKEEIEALEKNEYGQYIVDGLNKNKRSALWRATPHPCSAEDAYACLECPYNDCIAPSEISRYGNDYPPMYDGIVGAYEPALPHISLRCGKVAAQRKIVMGNIDL